MNVFATDRSVSVRCVLILFLSGHLVGHYVANLQFVHKHDFEAPFSPGLGHLLLKIRPPFGPVLEIDAHGAHVRRTKESWEEQKAP